MGKKIVKKAAIAAGGYPALAKGLKITRHAIYQWSDVPHERVLDVERLSGIPRHELRPDLYKPQGGAA